MTRDAASMGIVSTPADLYTSKLYLLASSLMGMPECLMRRCFMPRTTPRRTRPYLLATHQHLI